MSALWKAFPPARSPAPDVTTFQLNIMLCIPTASGSKSPAPEEGLGKPFINATEWATRGSQGGCTGKLPHH